MAFLLLFTSKVCRNGFFFSLLVTSMFAVLVSSYQFQVGGDSGWSKPTANMTSETYNEWATRNRFLIGDTLYFKYRGDSVLVVNSTDYQNCKTSNPIDKFDDGNTVFRFDRSGLFYFISGQPGHCKLGQKLVIRVMHPSETEPAEPAPSPEVAGSRSDSREGWGPPAMNSTTKLSVVCYFMTFLGSTLVILYWLM